MHSVDRSGAALTPAYTAPALQALPLAAQQPAAEAVLVAELSTPAVLNPQDQSAARVHAAADFDPVSPLPSSEAQTPVLSAHEPIAGVLRDEALTERLSTLRDATARRLINATYTLETLQDSLRQAGPGASEALFQQVEAYKRADHTVQAMGDLLKVLQAEAGVETLQAHLQDSAISEATGSELETDGIYGPGTDEAVRQRIQNPDATYVAPPAPRLGAEDVFVYQEGEVGEDGGTEMEAQANCGPASMAMVIERMGGEAPSMKALREEVNAPTGTRDGTYGLDSDQVTQGIVDTLAAQGIEVSTRVDIFSSKQSEDVLASMRESLAAGEDVILLTSNMGSGGATGHYVVVNEVREDGSFVVHDPQEPDGVNVVQTAADLEAAMLRRAGTERDTRVISIRRES